MEKDNTTLCVFIILAIMTIKLSAIILLYTTHLEYKETLHKGHIEASYRKYYKTMSKGL